VNDELYDEEKNDVPENDIEEGGQIRKNRVEVALIVQLVQGSVVVSTRLQNVDLYTEHTASA